MANPDPKTIPQGIWTVAASGVSQGQIKFLDSSCTYYHTFRNTGDPAPTGNPTIDSEAFADAATKLSQSKVGKSEEIGTLASADIYIYCAGDDGRIIVEV